MSCIAAVAGASGYAGGEILRFLEGHPDIEVRTVTAGPSSVGKRLSTLHPHLVKYGELQIIPTDASTLASHDLVFLALPHGHSGKIAREIEAVGGATIIVDSAADHRLVNKDEWDFYYGSDFAEPWTYGMPELHHSDEEACKAFMQRSLIKKSDHIAVPGCNVTAVTFALQPAIAAELVDVRLICATLAVGYSGAGRSLKQRFMAAEALGNVVPYSVAGGHRHIPEIVQNFIVAGAVNPRLTFTPVLVPTSRGILATVVAPLRENVTLEDINSAYSIYRDESAIDVLGANFSDPTGTNANGGGLLLPTTAPTVGTGRSLVSAHIDQRAGTLTALCALDNLGKGAAAAAVQCANIRLGNEEHSGISLTGIMP